MSSDERISPLGDLKPGLKNVICVFIVIDRGSSNLTRDGSVVRKCRVADRSGSIIFSLWNEEAEVIEPGDIIKLTKGYCSQWKGSLVLYCGKYGLLEKLGEFTMVYSEVPDLSVNTEKPAQQLLQQQHSRQAQHTAGNGPGLLSTPLGVNRNDNNHIPSFLPLSSSDHTESECLSRSYELLPTNSLPKQKKPSLSSHLQSQQGTTSLRHHCPPHLHAGHVRLCQSYPRPPPLYHGTILPLPK